MRRAARIDDNQREIAEALKRCGCSVEYLSAVGKGVPDLLVGFRGKNYLLEVKDGGKAPSKRRLTNPQKYWHSMWRGFVVIVESVDDALAAVGLGG